MGGAAALDDREKKSGGTGVFLPKIAVSRPSPVAFKRSISPMPRGQIMPSCLPLHAVIETSSTASTSQVLPNLTPESSPTAGAVADTENSMSGSEVLGCAMGAPLASEDHSSSGWQDLLAAPEVGGWSIKRAGRASSSASSHPHTMARLQPQWSSQVPAPHAIRSGSSAVHPTPDLLAPVPPPPRSSSRSTADNAAWEILVPTSAAPAGGHSYKQQVRSNMGAPGPAAVASGSLYMEGPCISRGHSGSMAARTPALATMFSDEVQLGCWGSGQPPVLNSMGSFSSTNGRLQQLPRQHHSAPLLATTLGRDQNQQHQLVPQAAIVPGSRVGNGNLPHMEAFSIEQQQQSDLLRSKLDSQILQLLQLRNLESGGKAAAGTAAAGPPLLQHQGPVYASMAAPGPDVLLTGSGLSVYEDACGMACMPLHVAGMQVSGMSGSGELPQLPLTSGDSASQLALGMHSLDQPLLHTDPCLAMFRDVMPAGSWDDQQYIGSGSCLASQVPTRQARLCEVKQKMRQLADMQKVQRQLQEELLSLLQ